MKNNTKHIVLSIATLSFAIVWTLGSFISNNISASGNTKALLELAVSIGLFSFIFQVLFSSIRKILETYFSDESKLAGEWFQIFIIENYKNTNNNTDQIRHGPVSFIYSDNKLAATATNKKINSISIPSSWHSDIIQIQGHQVVILFSSTGPGRGSTHGQMFYQLQGAQPRKMIGHFSDSSPATHYGSIELYTDIVEYQNRLRQLTSTEQHDNAQ